MIRQALIPAAGRGLRLDRPGTPKPLVDVGGQPMLLRLIGQLDASGVEEVVVVLGYGAAEIERALRLHSWPRAKVTTLRHDGWEVGLGSTVLAARARLERGVLVAMADHVFDDTLVQRMVAEPPQRGVAVLAETRLDRVFEPASAVQLATAGRAIIAAGRDLDAHDAIDAGLLAAGPELFDALAAACERAPDSELCDAVAALAALGQARAVPIGRSRDEHHDAVSGDWDDVDTAAALVHAEMRLRRQRRSSRVAPAQVPDAPPAGREYEMLVGAPQTARVIVGRGFVRAPERLPLIPDNASSSPSFVFSDRTVHSLYGRDFVAALRGRGYDILDIVLEDGEGSKSLASYSELVERVLGHGVDERSVFISLGGGVVCNVCGFVASTIYRGLDLVHLPTTLMAQCDAAISHKQAINGYRGKNLVGSYYLPRMIAADVDVLATLDRRQRGDGLAEVIKHAIGQDQRYVELLLDPASDPEDPEFLEAVIRRNVELKCELCVSDPHERREALILQYGHTVGHAIEHLSGYQLYHGESVAIGMVVAARVARLMGACDDALVSLHVELCSRYGLPTRVPESIRPDDILEALRFDKKYLTEGTRMALLTGVGQLWQVGGEYAIPVSDQVLIEAIAATR